MLFIIVMTQQFIKKGKILRKSDHVLVLYSNQEKKKKSLVWQIKKGAQNF